jgi:hypothetical protein
MALKIGDKKDFCAGLMFILMGGFFALWAQNYPMGTAVRMGPAYFPTILGWILAGLGVIVLVRSFFLQGEAPRKTNWRPLTLVLGAIFVFGFLLDKAGLVVSCFALVFISSLGGWDFKWKEQVINATLMTAVNVGIFYFGLGLPFKLLPWS